MAQRLTMDGTILDANPAALEWLGYSRDEYVGRDLRSFHLDPEAIQGVLTRLLQGETVHNVPVAVTAKSGEIKYGLVTAGANRRSQRDVSVRWVITDISALVGAEAVRQSAVRVRQQIDLAPEGILLHRDRRIIHANPAANRLFSTIELGGLDGRSVLDLIIPGDHPRIEELLRKVETERKATEFSDLTGQTFCGELLSLQAISAPIMFFGQLAIQTVFRDVTFHHRAQEALKESEERYRSLVELSPEAVFVLRGARIVYANQAAARLFGAVDPKALLGMSFLDLVHTDSLDAVQAYVLQTHTGRPVVRLFQEKGVRLDGKTVEMEAIGIPVTYQGLASVQVLIRDETERNRLQGQLVSQAREIAILEERQRMARELHDTLAQGFAGILMQLEATSGLLDGKHEEVAEHIDRAKLVARDSLAEARRAISDLRSAGLENSTLKGATREEIARFAATGREAVDFQASGREPRLTPQTRQHILRICQEALANVRKHARATQVSVSLTFHGNTVELRVADNGIGFDPSHPPAHSGRASFGLVGMRERASLLGGSVKLLSKTGKGTRVLVRVPVVPETLARSA